MPIVRAFYLIVFIAGCGAHPNAPGQAEGAKDPGVGTTESARSSAKYEYVGTYHTFTTPMGSAVSVLMVDGQKIKLSNRDDTRYVNISSNQGIPDMRRSGTYGVNGEFRKSTGGGGDVFIVREMEYLGGGQKIGNARQHEMLPDFFVVDRNARGPLTLSELQINFPASLTRFFNARARECFYRKVESLAADLGDPLSMPPIRRVLLTNEQNRWDTMTVEDKRLQLARYVTSMALHGC